MLNKDILVNFKKYRLQATFKSGKSISQEVVAYDTYEAMILFASRNFISDTIFDEDYEVRDELTKIEFIPLEEGGEK